MKKTLLLLITIISYVPLVGMDDANDQMMSLVQNQNTHLPPPPAYLPPQSFQELSLSRPPSSPDNTQGVYLPQQPGNLLSRQAPSLSVEWLRIVALISQAQQHNRRGHNQSSTLLASTSSPELDDEGDDSGDPLFKACLLPFCIPIDLACLPIVCWRRAHTPSTAGRNQFCYCTRNVFSDCTGIETIHITHTNPNDADSSLVCSTPAWDDTSADTNPSITTPEQSCCAIISRASCSLITLPCACLRDTLCLPSDRTLNPPHCCPCTKQQCYYCTCELCCQQEELP